MADFLKREGDKYKHFLLVKYCPIEELKSVLRELVHVPTGAQIMHIENDDPENLFCLSFKTLPSSSNGAPHILEHTVLCGSRRFPVKDPFFSMNRRSLNTFMNALTGSDFTCYPAATQVEKDFYNLLEVYLDAVFHPLLKEMSFLQEGHRFEFSIPDDPTSDLEIKGIVYNEMKGSLSSADARIWQAMLHALVPDLPYAYNAGGDPTEIPKLGYDELIKFYETYYHPSRCLYFFYGDLPLKKHLDFIDDKSLKQVQPLSPLSSIPQQRRFSAPRKQELFYPITEREQLDKQTIVCFGWLTIPLLDQEEVLALGLLDSVLMDTDASPLKKALLDSELCIQVDGFLDTEMSEIPYVIICKGCDKKQIAELERVLHKALETIAKKGIPKELLEAAMHQLEFSRLEISGDHSPFGLQLFMRSALAKQHGCPAENALTVHALFETLSQKINDKNYLPSLLSKLFIDNHHFVRLDCFPDPDLSSKEEEQEKKALAKLQAALTYKQKAKIIEQTKELAAYQKLIETQTIHCLPKVSLEDVPVQSRDFLLKHDKKKNLEIFHHDSFTNYIAYADLVFDLSQVPHEELFYVHLLMTLLPELGAGKRSYTQNLEYMHAHTGGMGAASHLHVQVNNYNHAHPSVQIRGKALYRKLPYLFELIKDMATSPLFEKKRIEDLIKQIHNGLKTRITRHALKYATHLALSGFSTPSYISQLWHGLAYYHKIQQIIKFSSKQLTQLIEKLESLSASLLCAGSAHLVLSADASIYQQLEKEDFYGLTHLPSHPFSPWKADFTPPVVTSQARTISSSVAFTVEAFKTIGYAHPDAAALQVATLLFENKVLHQRIREQGGAYGSGANYNALWGNFYFHSYRDPHIARTLNTFHDALESLSTHAVTNEELEEAKLGIIQQLDLPISPGTRAMVAYSWWRDGKTHAMRQQFRDRILSVSPQEIRKAIEEHLIPQQKHSVVVSFGSKELIERENKLMMPPHHPLPIMAIS